MTTATLPQVWRGRTGRTYVPAGGRTVRHGGMATVRKVVGRGGPVDRSVVPDGFPLALKLWNEGEEEALDQLQEEARILEELSSQKGELPCPRLYDLVGNPVVTGLVMEWCPADLERWWREKLDEPDAFGRLMATLAEAARRVGDTHRFYLERGGSRVAHGDLKPSNILIDMNGRWLISDFGAARIAPPEDSPLATSRVIAGTENFISPEALFHAQQPEPAAMDTWALGATTFALLGLRRMVLDGGPVPRNGTHSPRFRTARMHQVLDLYGREPTRFRGRALDPEALPDPGRLPEADRRAIREGLRGVFGTEDDPREQLLADELIPVLERSLALDPGARYTDAADLVAAFEHLTRSYIALAASDEPAPSPEADALAELAQQRDQARRRSDALHEQVQSLSRRLAELQSRELPTPVEPAPPPEPRPPVWLVAMLSGLLLMQVLTFLSVVGILLLSAL